MTRHEEDGELSEAQRLTMLEDTVSTNRIMLLIMGILGVVAISVAVTVAVVNLMQPDATYVDTRAFARLEKDVDILKDAAIAQEKNTLRVKEVLDTSNASTFKALMMEQEQSYQRHLTALKQGMRDLARMTPGSRTWLDIYDEQMDQALAESRARMARLERMQTSQLPASETFSLQPRPAPVQVNQN